jgi:hypothetical protein
LEDIEEIEAIEVICDKIGDFGWKIRLKRKYLINPIL